MKLNLILEKIAAQSGIAHDNPHLLAVTEGVKAYDLADEVANSLIADRLSMDAAKNNTDLRKHYHAQILSTLDGELDAMAQTFGLTDEQKAALKAETSTTKRVQMFPKLLKEGLEKSFVEKGQGSEELKRQIVQLNGEIAAKKEEIAAKEKEHAKNLKATKIGWEIDRRLSTMPLIFPNTVSKDLQLTMARTALQNKMAQEGVVIEITDDGKIQVQKDGALFFKNNINPTVEDYIKSALLDTKILAVNTQPKKNGQQPAPREGNKTIRISNGFDESAAEADALLEALS